MDCRSGSDLPYFMETLISEADYVIMVCTPEYAGKANSGKGGVGYGNPLSLERFLLVLVPQISSFRFCARAPLMKSTVLFEVTILHRLQKR